MIALFVTISLQVIANSIPNVSHIPFVLFEVKTVILLAKHQTLMGHISKSLCQYLYKLCGIFESSNVETEQTVKIHLDDILGEGQDAKQRR